jgi:hypothetical protein
MDGSILWIPCAALILALLIWPLRVWRRDETKPHRWQAWPPLL